MITKDLFGDVPFGGSIWQGTCKRLGSHLILTDLIMSGEY